MQNRKKHLRLLFCLAGLFLFCFHSADAQPTCWAHFDPSDTCHYEYQGKEFIFLGRVVSVLPLTTDSGYAEPQKAVVEVEAPLKGSLPKKTELFLDRHCFGRVEENQRYIFTANRVENEKFSGLFSTRWSEPLLEDKYTKDEIQRYLAEIRAMAGGVKRPRLSGFVIEDTANNKGRYMISTTDVRKLFTPGFNLRPMPDVVVTAKLKDGGQEFKTATGADGSYAFNDLPKGVYEVFTNLPKEYDVKSEGLSMFGEAGKSFIEINDYVCGRRILFNAQLQGDVKIRFDNASSRWSHIIVHLWRVFESKDGQRNLNEFFWDAAKDKFLAAGNSGDIGYSYHFKNVPAGKYVLMLSVTIDPARASDRVYYPGTFEEKKAAIINVEAGKTSNIEFSIPDLPEN
jgi:hypothetical protein